MFVEVEGVTTPVCCLTQGTILAELDRPNDSDTANGGTDKIVYGSGSDSEHPKTRSVTVKK